jgi:dihydrodipicolinate synthase/N-acetylneuraminate lyase
VARKRRKRDAEMSASKSRRRVSGCYITIPTMFRDPDLEVDIAAIQRHVRFLRARGIGTGNAVLLAGGAAGDFSTMTFEERVRVAEAVRDAAEGAVPLAMGAQTTSTRELVRLARAAESLGYDFIQVSCPFYFTHTEGDFLDFVRAGAEAADIGIIVYNTFWTSAAVSFHTVERLIEIDNVVALKWATPRTDARRPTHDACAGTAQDALKIVLAQIRIENHHYIGRRCGCRGRSERSVVRGRQPAVNEFPA